MSESENTINKKRGSATQDASSFDVQNSVEENKTPLVEQSVPKNTELTFLEKIAQKNKGIQKDILLPKYGGLAQDIKKTPVRDQLFTSKILDQEKQINQRKSPELGISEDKKVMKPDASNIAEGSFIKNIRTYQSDVQEQIKNQKTSVVQMVLEEQKKKDAKKTGKSITSKRNLPFFILSIIFIIAGISIVSAGVWYYIFKDTDETKIPKNELVDSMILAEAQKEINITKKNKDEIVKAISEEIRTLDIRLDFIEHIYPTKEIAQPEKLGEEGLMARTTAQEFFRKLEFKMPDTLLRSLGEKFMIGIHSFNGNEPFIILTTDFFENTFAGMLVWEKFIAQDIFPLFLISAEEDILEKKFEDRVVKNRDLRVLTDKEGKIIILYSFYNKNTLIIATSKDTLDEVIARLQRI